MTKVVADLKQYGTVQRAFFGIKGLLWVAVSWKTASLSISPVLHCVIKRKEFGVVDGVWVREIVDNGSAAGADIKVDDVIIGVDNKKVP